MRKSRVMYMIAAMADATIAPPAIVIGSVKLRYSEATVISTQ